MAIKIRLARHGRKGSPFYRIVVANSTSPRDGKYIEKLGTYNPMSKDENGYVSFSSSDIVAHWLARGAQPTEKVIKLLKVANIDLTPKIEKQYSIKLAARRNRPSRKEEKEAKA